MSTSASLPFRVRDSDVQQEEIETGKEHTVRNWSSSEPPEAIDTMADTRSKEAKAEQPPAIQHQDRREAQPQTAAVMNTKAVGATNERQHKPVTAPVAMQTSSQEHQRKDVVTATSRKRGSQKQTDPRTQQNPRQNNRRFQPKQGLNYRVQKTDQQTRNDAQKQRRKRLREVAIKTQESMWPILSATEQRRPRSAYLVKPGHIFPLDPKCSACPKLGLTRIKVVQGDTFDTALALHNARDILGSRDPMPVCVLNFANAKTPGGGWLNGKMAQEEELCYRSTLSEALPRRFYPMRELECIYSPTVIIFRENFERGHSFMWKDKPDLLPVVSVISMAAIMDPQLDMTVTPHRYEDSAVRELTKNKMRAILRVAAYKNHRRLILGALGCGVFHNPNQEVADCWLEILKEEEFKGWFEMVVFAIMDKEAADDGNLKVFQTTLEGISI